MSTKLIVSIVSGFGGIIVANKAGNKLYGDEKITNPIEAVGYLALLLAAGGVAANSAYKAATTIEKARDVWKRANKKDEEDETESETEENEA